MKPWAYEKAIQMTALAALYLSGLGCLYYAYSIMILNPITVGISPGSRMPSLPYAFFMGVATETALFLFLALPAVFYLEKTAAGLLKKHIFILSILAFLGAVCAAYSYNAGSVDITYYLAFGRTFAILGNDPYQPLDIAIHDPIIRQLQPTWIHLGANYGPSAIWIFSIINLLMPEDPVWLLAGLKTLWLMGLTGTAYIIYVLARKSAVNYPISRTFAFFANPVIWMELLRDGHIEAAIVCSGALLLYLLYTHKWFASGLTLAVLCSLKLVMLPLVPLVLVYIYRTASVAERRSAFVNFLSIFCFYIIGNYMYFNGADWVNVYHFSSNHFQCPQLVPEFTSYMSRTFPFHFNGNSFATRMSSLLLLVGTASYGFYCVKTKKMPSLEIMFATVTLAVLLCVPFHYPWYVFWPLVPILLAVRSPAVLWLVMLWMAGYCLGNNGCSGQQYTAFLLALTGAVWLWQAAHRQRI